MVHKPGHKIGAGRKTDKNKKASNDHSNQVYVAGTAKRSSGYWKDIETATADDVYPDAISSDLREIEQKQGCG